MFDRYVVWCQTEKDLQHVVYSGVGGYDSAITHFNNARQRKSTVWVELDGISKGISRLHFFSLPNDCSMCPYSGRWCQGCANE